MSQAASSPVNDAFPPALAEEAALACGRPIGADALVRVLPIINKRGLHARASAKFVQTVERHDARAQPLLSAAAESIRPRYSRTSAFRRVARPLQTTTYAN